MCLVRVKQEEDVVIPYRVVRRDEPQRRSQRYSRTEIVEDRRSPRTSHPHVVTVPAPAPPQLRIPDPQPAPIFAQAPAAQVRVTAPPPAAPEPRYVHVSPSSSVTSHSHSHSDYVVRERITRRERQSSPAISDYEERSPRYEHYRYVDGPDDRYSDRYARRERSISREGRRYSRGSFADDPRSSRSSYRNTRERVTVSTGDGRRRRDYHR